MRKLRRNQSGILYILVTIVLFLVVVGFCWFAAWAIMVPLDDAMTTISDSYHNASWGLYTQYNYATSFMTNFWAYLLALGFFGLVFWVYMYSQHKGAPYQ